MKIKRSNGEKLFNVFNIFFMLCLIMVTLYPLLYVVFASFSKSDLFMLHEGLLFRPAGFSLSSYEAVLKNPNILSGYRNTVIILVFGVSVNIFLTVLGAYFLSRKGVLLNKVITLFIIFTMYFHGGLIPFYLIVKGLKMNNSLLALIIPNAINTFNLIIMRTAFAAVPDSMEESAKLDGANHYTILFKIMIPLAMPTIAVLVLYYGVSHWNAWFHATIFLQNRNLFPLQVILREVLITNSTESMSTGVGGNEVEMLGETIKYAVIVVATLPILMLYPFLQRYFVKGIMIGAVKG